MIGGDFSNTINVATGFQYVVIDTNGQVGTEPIVVTKVPVLDNTLTVPPTNPSSGDSYIPATGSTGLWSGLDGKIVTWSGSTWNSYTPVTNDITTITTGVNAGLVIDFNGTSWITAPSTLLKVYNYLSTSAYNATDLVIKNNIIYQANAIIPANTTFAIGTTGATWTQIGGKANADWSLTDSSSNGFIKNKPVFSAIECIQTGSTQAVALNGTVIWNTIKNNFGDITYSTSTGIYNLPIGIYKVDRKCAFTSALKINGVIDTTSGYDAADSGTHLVFCTTPSTLEVIATTAGTNAIQTSTVASNITITKVSDYLGSFSAISNGTATNNLNNNTSTVTFTIPYTGTAGVISTSGWSITGTGITVSNISSVVGNGTSLTFTATVVSANTISVPNTATQTYILNTGNSTVIITGTRITDAIIPLLSTSLSAYNSATSNSWIQVTASEYANLMNLQSTTKWGSTDAILNQANTNQYGGNITETYTNNATKLSDVPANSYLVAFATRMLTGTGVSLLPRISTANTFGGTYNAVGNQTAAVTFSQNTLYFVRKWNSSSTPDNTTIANVAMAFIGGSNISLGLGNSAPMAILGGASNAATVTLNASSNWQISLQGISTTIKQG